MNRRLFLIFHGRFPSEKAASLFAAKSAEAFSNKGLRVTLVVPKRNNQISEETSSYYNIKNNFNVAYIPAVDFFESRLPRKAAFWLSTLSFSFNVRGYLKKESASEDIIYSNEIQPLFLASFLRKNCFYEMHDLPESKLGFFGYFLKRMKWVLIHNTWKKNKIAELFPGIDGGKFICEPNAVDISVFDIPVSKEEARRKVGLPLDKKIFLYTGHLYGWKGVDTLALGMKNLVGQYLAVFVGGTEKDIKSFRAKYIGGKGNNIQIVGFKKHQEIPVWQKAADILVLPNTATEAISAYYTSPMKLYEYMASKRLIVASDLPSIREIVDEKSAVLVKPDDSQALAKALVDHSAMDISSYDVFTENAFAKVKEHTWGQRAERILNFMQKHD